MNLELTLEEKINVTAELINESYISGFINNERLVVMLYELTGAIANEPKEEKPTALLAVVSNQRELLKAFIEYHDSCDIIGGNDNCIDNFLKSLL